MKPSAEILVKLCEALGRSPDYMFRPLRVVLPKVSFRKRKAFGEKDTAVLPSDGFFKGRFRNSQDVSG